MGKVGNRIWHGAILYVVYEQAVHSSPAGALPARWSAEFGLRSSRWAGYVARARPVRLAVTAAARCR